MQYLNYINHRYFCNFLNSLKNYIKLIFTIKIKYIYLFYLKKNYCFRINLKNVVKAFANNFFSKLLI